MAARSDIAFHLGSTWEYECECRNADGELISIQSAEWRLASAAQLIKATVGNGITITGQGKCTVRIPPSMQTSVPAGIHRHELWVVEAGTLIESVQIVGSANIAQSLRKQFP